MHQNFFVTHNISIKHFYLFVFVSIENNTTYLNSTDVFSVACQLIDVDDSFGFDFDD